MKMRKILTVTALLISFVAMGALHAGAQGKMPRISIQELKTLMDKETPMTIIDVQSRDVYAMEHIKGAISVPWKSQIDLEDVWSLPAEELIITYCDCGPGEADSDDVARQLFHMGYENVKVLEDPAIHGWREAGYPMEKKN
jgi:rhodanese-related sulfurtransferase